jgi:glycosyltransferase involved in cell wall biosynthesis
MPVYNCERFVAQAVASVLDQDHPAKEVLVIDDGSRDGSLQVLKSFGDAIRVVTVPNGGPARARNLGMRMAQGEYIAFLDADDVWAREKLSAQVAHMQADADLGACYTRWHVWPAQADGSWQLPPDWTGALGRPGAVAGRSGWIYAELLFECHLLTTTVMLRASAARSVGEFDTDLPVGEDYDYWLRLARRFRIDRLDCTSSLYRVVPGSASRRPHVVNHELEVLQRTIDRFGLVNPDGQAIDPRRVAQRLDQLSFQHAYNHMMSGDARVARRAFGRDLRRHPLRPRLWAHWLRSALRSAASGNKAVTS